MKTKTVRQYNLPHSSKYLLLDISRGSIEDNATSCDNCGAIISNIAHIKNEDGKHFYVGMDCAETLTSLKDSEDFQMAKMYMREANKIFNAYKKHKDFEAEVNENNGFIHAFFTWKEDKQTKQGMKYQKQCGSGLVFNNTLSLLPESFKKEFGITAKWQ